MASIKRVSPQEAKELVDAGYTYVDVRSEPEFRAGHPAGAVNVPLLNLGPSGMVPNRDFVDVMNRAFGPEGKIVLGCKTGGRSMQAAEILVGAGFGAIIEQRAGFDGARNPFGQMVEPGWAGAGLPVEAGDPPERSYEALKKKLAG
jgi:rhodanese-related sulfurtransferase